MWVVEEFRRNMWVRISGDMAEPEARAAVRLLAAERPWRGYRLARA
jgi:hypothetical protein